jgi:folate-binding protein YgfZ
MIVRLGRLAALRVTGTDAADLLGRILSNDVHRLGVGDVQDTARLDDRGRVAALYRLARVATDAFVLMADGGAAAEHAAGLDRYVFGEDVRIDVLAESGWWTDGIAPTDAVSRSRYGRDGWDVPGPAPADAVDESAMEPLRVRSGALRWPDDAPSNALLSDLGMSSVASLTKGCYPGQETVQRQFSRGEVRRALVGLRLDGPAPAGAPLVDDGDVLGRLGLPASDPDLGWISLGVVRRPHDRVGTHLRAGERRAQVVALPMVP